MTKNRLLIFLVLCVILNVKASAQERQEINLCGKGWKLWFDKDAKWQNAIRLLSPVDISKLNISPPTGGWEKLESAEPIIVNVSGTTAEYLQKKSGLEGEFSVLRKVILHFDAVRYRCEVFLNRKLVGNDLVGNTPFEVDLSDIAKSGEMVQLAFRITDPAK